MINAGYIDTDLSSFVRIVKILWSEMMEKVATGFALIVLWPFLSWIKTISGWFFSFCLLCGKIKAFSFETLSVCESSDSGSNKCNLSCF